jgi:hypothetical protein
MRNGYGSVVLFGCLAAAASLPAFAQPDKVVVGINMVNPGRFKVEQQNAMLSEMKKAGVRVIRCGVSPDDKGLDFAQGIKIELGVSVQFRDGAPTRQSQPKEFPGMWGTASAANATGFLLVSTSKTPRIEIPSAPKLCPEAFPIKASDDTPRNGAPREPRLLPDC